MGEKGLTEAIKDNILILILEQLCRLQNTLEKVDLSIYTIKELSTVAENIDNIEKTLEK